MQNKFCVIFFERKIQGSASAGSYISLEEVILNKSLTCRKANITAQQYNLSLDKYHKSACGFIQLPNPLQGLGFSPSFLLFFVTRRSLTTARKVVQKHRAALCDAIKIAIPSSGLVVGYKNKSRFVHFPYNSCLYQ